MPLAMKKRCGVRGCPNTTRNRFCEEHAPIAAKIYDRKRGSTTERGYDGAWKKLSQQRRDLDAYLCQDCLKRGVLTPSPLVDHIIPIHVRTDWRLEIGNTQVLCTNCHRIKTSEDMQRYGGRAKRELTPEQMKNRSDALRITRPPRDHEAQYDENIRRGGS